VSLVIGDLQQQTPQVGTAALWVFRFGGALRVPSCDFQVGLKPKVWHLLVVPGNILVEGIALETWSFFRVKT
jgi:hypothetical protein